VFPDDPVETPEDKAENDKGKECWDAISPVLCGVHVPGDFTEANTLEIIRLIHCVDHVMDFSDASASALSVILQRLVADHTAPAVAPSVSAPPAGGQIPSLEPLPTPASVLGPAVSPAGGAATASSQAQPALPTGAPGLPPAPQALVADSSKQNDGQIKKVRLVVCVCVVVRERLISFRVCSVPVARC
jgi:hypothetical protein